MAGIAFRAAGKSVRNFPAASKFARKLFQQGISDSHSLLEFSENHRPLSLGLFRGAVFRHGGGALKQPIKQPTETPTSTLALMGRFPSLMGRFPTLMGRFTDFAVRGRFTS